MIREGLFFWGSVWWSVLTGQFKKTTISAI